MVKNLHVNVRDLNLMYGWGRFPEGGNGNPHQHSCLENTMDRGPWWATVQVVAKSQSQLSTHAPCK